MFSEILRIKPVLDPAGAKKMELSLTQRFSKVAKTFGGGLMKVVKGSILGISVGLLSKLLNPIEAIEERIKNLLGESTDLVDAADKFGSTPGELKQLQDVAGVAGVKPEQLQDTLSKFASAIETARKEIKDGTELSKASVALQKFANDENIVESFKQFMTALKEVEAGPAGKAGRRLVEQEVLGERQSGAARRLIESDFESVTKRLREPGAEKLTKVLERNASLAEQQRALEISRNTQSFVRASGQIGPEMIKDIERRAQAAQERDDAQLKSYSDLARAANAIDNVLKLFQDVNTMLQKGIGMLGDLVTKITKVTESGFFRRFLGGGSK